MFKKVYKSKEVPNFRDNAFKLTEVDRNCSFQGKKNRYSQSDIDAYIDEQEGLDPNFVQDDDFFEEEEFYSHNNSSCDDEDDFVQSDNGYSYEDDSSAETFGSMDAASTDWGSVDFGSVDWGKY